MYTETMLKKLNKDGLLKIAADNEIIIPEGATNPQIIALILEKGCPSPSGAYGKTDETVDDDIPKYSKEYFLKSNWYSHKRGALQMLLEDDKEYSIADVEKLIAKSRK